MFSLLTVAEPGSRVETAGQSAERAGDGPAGPGDMGTAVHAGYSPCCSQVKGLRANQRQSAQGLTSGRERGRGVGDEE